MTTKIRVGDIAEISTPQGLAYVQYTHDGQGMTELVRVLPGLYSSRPNLELLAQERELYFIFYTLKHALRAGLTKIACNQHIPEPARAVPLMRHAAVEGSWRILPALAPLNVETLQRTPVVRSLTKEQRQLSIRVLRPHPAMVKELARGWTPERAESLEEQDRAMARARRAAGQHNPNAVDAMHHYLYFPRKNSADDVGEQLRNRGYSVEVRKGADGKNWLALAHKALPKTDEEMDQVRDEMESLAAQFGGEYDGWEAAVDSVGRGNVQ